LSLFKKLILSACCLTALVIGFVIMTHFKVSEVNLLKTPQFITIKHGSNFNQFSQLLIEKNIINDRFWMRNYVRVYRDLAHIKAGTYQILPNTSVKQILTLVSSGEEHQFSITFVEGTRFTQWLEQLRSHPQIKHTLLSEDTNKNITTEIVSQLKLPYQHPEGLFFPDTYAFTNNTTDIEILRRAFKKMNSELNTYWQQKESNLPYDTPYQALIMASIIEKESGEFAEHEIISSVFVNRLHKGMRLQTDPTVIYGLGDRYKGDIKRKHLKEKTAYNTYRINGLPPTPIAMPGKSAIYAALHPAATDYLYFVSNGQGKHIFSTNLTDHNKAVAQYQLNN